MNAIGFGISGDFRKIVNNTEHVQVSAKSNEAPGQIEQLIRRESFFAQLKDTDACKRGILDLLKEVVIIIGPEAVCDGIDEEIGAIKRHKKDLQEEKITGRVRGKKTPQRNQRVHLRRARQIYPYVGIIQIR